MKIDPIIPIWLMAIISVAIIALKRKGLVPYIRQIIIAILLFVINLRIMVPNGKITQQTIETNSYVLFVIDNTVSMYAEDYNEDGETRREAVQADCAHIIESMPGAHFATITFANDAMLASPFTTNGSYEESAIRTLTPVAYYYANGTTLNTAYDLMESQLQALDEDYDGAYVSVFFISDGEITSDESLESFSGLKQYVDSGAVLGYGTEAGGQMHAPAYYGDESPELVTDENGDPGVSKIDESNLKAVAKDLGIDYIHMTSSDLVDSTVASINKKVSEIGDVTKSREGYNDIYYFFAIPLVGLLGWEIVSMRRNRNHRRNKKGVRADEPQA